MALILYYLTLKINNTLNPKRNTWAFIGLISFSLLGIFYGWMSGAFLNGKFIAVQDQWVSRFKEILLVLLIVLTIGRAYFPSYRPLQTWLKPFHPIKPFHRYLINICGDLASTFFFGISCFIVSVTWISIEFTFIDGIILFLVLIAAQASRRIIQTMVEQRLSFNKISLAVLTLSIFLSCASVTFLALSLISLNLVIPILWISILLANFAIEELTTTEPLQIYTADKKARPYSVDLLWNNKSIKVTLIMAVVFKTAFLTLDIFFFYKKGTHMYGNFPIIWVLASPAIIFTYIFNNVWGYMRNFWLLADRAAANGKALLKLLLPLIALPLLIDFIIAVIYFAVIKDEIFLEGLVMYISCVPLFTVMSLYWSSRFPILIDKPVSMKANTSVWASLVLFSVSAGFLLLFLSPWFYVLAPLSWLASYFLYYRVTNAYQGQRFNLFLKLYK